MSAPTVDLVVPSAGRPSLQDLLRGLAAGSVAPPGRVIVVDDRPLSRRGGALLGRRPRALEGRIEVLPGPAAGPAAARNVGWRASRAEWVAFLDDDVVPPSGWAGDLMGDLARAEADVAGVQGGVVVPLPAGRRPTDRERGVAGLEHARWATADMAYRRSALVAVGGFDERFPRAYREDADIGLRVTVAGWRIVQGRREVRHPARAAGPLASVRAQAGNADDALMAALHGRGWRERAGSPRGRLRSHVVVTAAAVAALASRIAGRRRTALAAGAAWTAGTLELSWRRIGPGPRTRAEAATMLLTSVLIPPAACYHRLAGLLRRRTLLSDLGRAPYPLHATSVGSRAGSSSPPAAVLLDRDGTLIEDVPYNGDPDRVVPMNGAREALTRLRAAGVALGVVSNQSGVARGLLTPEDVAAVNARVEELLGPLGPWAVCPHGPDAGCSCRKPAPGLVLRAARELGVEPSRCVVVGDIGADVEAARAAGARGVLVPTERTLAAEVEAATEVAPDLGAAVELLLGQDAA